MDGSLNYNSYNNRLKDWSNLVFESNFSSPEEMFKTIPGLKKYFGNIQEEELRTQLPHEPVLPLDKVIRYIILMYKEGSPLFEEFPSDIDLRKDAALTKAGFIRISEDEDGQQWPDVVEEIIKYENVHVNKWIFDFLKVQNPTWREIQLLDLEIEKLYEQRYALLLNQESNPTQKRLMNFDFTGEIQAKQDKKETLLTKFYNNDKGLQDATHFEMFPISPENVFKELKVPESIQKIMQTKDVPEDARLDRAQDL